jgi:hypothetical protein
MSEPLFPIMDGYSIREEIPKMRASGLALMVIALPWAMLAPHEAQARSNHGGQTLKRLAERGGLGVCEAMAVLEDRSWRRMDQAEAHRRLVALLAEFEAKRAAPNTSDASLADLLDGWLTKQHHSLSQIEELLDLLMVHRTQIVSALRSAPPDAG